ncbi:ATPase [Hyphomonas sp.]|uniref:F0F1 ATP synthase subunit B family protein n=1 Tax=Hyphomonas sp. TaxID=87 RepID=UPI00352736B9
MSFDWVTFGFQIVNVLLLLAILQHFLFRPVADVIARRQAATDAALNAADKAKAEAEAATRKALAEADATASARQDVLAKAHKEAEAQSHSLIDKAHAEAARIVAEGKAARERGASDVEAQALARARDLAAVIAERALTAQPQDFGSYLSRLIASLQNMPAAERGALLKGGNLKLRTAAPLSESEESVVKSALAPFEIDPDIATAPELIAGLELQSDSGAIRNSLAHDLEQITEAMRDDRQG